MAGRVDWWERVGRGRAKRVTCGWCNRLARKLVKLDKVVLAGLRISPYCEWCGCCNREAFRVFAHEVSRAEFEAAQAVEALAQ